MTNYYLTGRIANQNISVERVSSAIALGQTLPADVAATIADLRVTKPGFAAKLDKAVAAATDIVARSAAYERHPGLAEVCYAKGERHWRKYAAIFDAKATR